MKECIDYESLIPEYLDGELEASLCRELEAHIKECPSCKNALEEMRTLLSDISESAHPVPNELKAGVMSRIAAEKSAKKKKIFIRTLGSLAACLVIAVGAMSAWPYLGGNPVFFNTSESLDMEASVEEEFIADNLYPTVNEEEPEAPSEFVPENMFSQSDGDFAANEDASVGALRDESLSDGASAELKDDGDQNLSAGNSVSQYGDPFEETSGNIEADDSEPFKGSDTAEEVVITDPSQEEDVADIDYGALFMTRGAAGLAELLKEEE